MGAVSLKLAGVVLCGACVGLLACVTLGVTGAKVIAVVTLFMTHQPDLNPNTDPIHNPNLNAGPNPGFDPTVALPGF